MWEASLAAGDMDLFIESMFDLEGTLIDIKERVLKVVNIKSKRSHHGYTG